ncbi:E3 ubiquitin-protein ligase TRIM7-like [Etheostoma spectabile]|uniref:E3 ubiquitin-protein ligase TRIM7-like n=1 Tax=Etheostoma spectabile TaxID=54343 RepID=UPI0013AF6A35|nr:E3 ubiquitin-protein ligase TRIM7-like [Etheostoma spectabile]
MSCQSFLPVFLHRAEAEGLTSTPRSVDSPERCEEHEVSLSMFCLDDLEPLCEQCAAVSHAGHRVYLLTEAATDCKEELKISLNGLKKKMMSFEEVTQTCQHASRHTRTSLFFLALSLLFCSSQAEAKLTEEHIKKDFESLHQFLKEGEAARLLALREEWEEKKREAEEAIDRMNQVIKSMEEKIQLVEEELDAGGDGVGFLEHYQDTMSSTCHKEPQVCTRLIDVAKHLGNLQYTEWEKMKHIAPYSQFLSVHQCTSCPLPPSVPSHPRYIFQLRAGTESGSCCPCPSYPRTFPPWVPHPCERGFESGLHCWDIEVGSTNNWTIGVAAQSVSRKAEFEVCPEAGLWCISLREGEYQALTAPAQTLNSHQLSRVRVRLDWDEGTLDFMNADSETHLFTFKHCFTEKMYPFFESTTSCGGFAVLAKRVNISVEADYVPVEDPAITEEDQVMKSESCTEGDINASSAKTNSKISDCGRLTEDQKMPICSIREEEKTIPQRCTTKDELIKTKSAEKETTKDNKTAAKKQNRKPRLNVTYHVSLNRAHQQ